MLLSHSILLLKKKYSKLTVAFTNIHRHLLGLLWRSSVSDMYENYDLPNHVTVI